MDTTEIRKKVEAIIARYSKLGTVCDVWLSPDVMDTLDPRPPMARIMEDPYKIGDVFVTSFSQLKDNEFRVSFINSFEVLEDYESGSSN